MVKSKLSSKYQVVIPKEIRKEANLRIGEELTVVSKDGIINFIPQRPLKKMRGFVKGINTKGLREEKDRIWF